MSLGININILLTVKASNLEEFMCVTVSLNCQFKHAMVFRNGVSLLHYWYISQS